MNAAATPVAARDRMRLGAATAGVLLGAADTYVVVVALPSIMASVGIGLDQLQEATPIISGFLLGYIAVLPVAGRLSDVHGRLPVLTACLVVFAGGSLLTGSADTLASVVAGRALQGAGGGGLVPVTLALAADLWPAGRRGPALGAVSAAQELGSVAGPVYGALLTAASTWRAIFYVNIPIAGAVAAATRRGRTRDRRRADALGRALLGATVACAALAVTAPPALADDATVGAAFAPLVAAVPESSPLAIATAVLLVVLVVRSLSAPATVRAALPLRGVVRVLRAADWPGAALLSASLACVVATFAGADPQHGVVGTAAPVLLPLAALLAALFVVRELRTPDPLVDLRALRARAAVGSLAVNLAAGAALMAALVDVPVFARVTVDASSQVAAALVLGRLLVAVPAGALAGGFLVGRAGNRLVAAAGLTICAASLLAMSSFGATALADPLMGIGWLHPTDPALVAAGFGFGLATVPATAAILGAVPARLHGVAVSLTVAARMVGMLAGISLLTAIGLRRFYSVQAMLPSPVALCPHTPLSCAPYAALERGAAVDELHVVFAGAAACALLGALLAAALLGGRGAHARAAWAGIP